MLGERGGPHSAMQRVTVLVVHAGLLKRTEIGVAQMWRAIPAKEALPACSQQRHDQRVPRFYVRHILSDFVDYPGGFMAGHHGQPAAPIAADEMRVTMTDRGGDDANFGFIAARRDDPDVLDDQRVTEFVADCRFHSRSLLGGNAPGSGPLATVQSRKRQRPRSR